MSSDTHAGYYIPHGSHWPLVGSVGLTTLVVGFAMMLNGAGVGSTLLVAGVAITLFMMFGWFGTVIRESESGTYNDQVDISFRWAMGWFIFSEVMFFAAFFGALYYARVYSVPWLGGEGAKGNAHMLWEGFQATWPLIQMPDASTFDVPKEVIPAWGIPALNTLILLTSGVTVTFAHWALKKNSRGPLVMWLIATVALGFTFLGFQIAEYGHAYNELNLTLESGIYGSTFFMLTGFHGFHVTMGAIMLSIITLRCMKGHFTPGRHFAFEAVAWYWHFVDVVWLGLFVFVYWL